MIKKFIYRSALFVVLSLGLLYLADYIFTKTLKKDPLNKVAFAHQFKNDSFDFAFLGNSRVLVMSRTEELEKLTGKKGINLGLDGSNPMHQYLILVDFLEKNTIGKLYLNIDPWSLQLKMNNPARIWCFMPYLYDDSIYANLSHIFGRKKTVLWKYAPFIRYAFFNSRQGPVSVLNSELGFMRHPYTKTGDLRNIPNKTIPLKKIINNKAGKILLRQYNLQFLERIMELCQQKSVKLYIYTAPVFEPYYRKHVNVQQVIDSNIVPLCNKYQASYTNFCTQPLCNDTAMFYDLHHLNKKGVEQFTPMLKKLLE